MKQYINRPLKTKIAALKEVAKEFGWTLTQSNIGPNHLDSVSLRDHTGDVVWSGQSYADINTKLEELI